MLRARGWKQQFRRVEITKLRVFSPSKLLFPPPGSQHRGVTRSKIYRFMLEQNAIDEKFQKFKVSKVSVTNTQAKCDRINVYKMGTFELSIPSLTHPIRQNSHRGPFWNIIQSREKRLVRGCHIFLPGLA